MPDAQAPAGGANSTVVDLAEWLRLTLASGVLDGERLIDEAALDQTKMPHAMTSPPQPTIADRPGQYGLGWALRTDLNTGAVTWNHSGAFSTGANTQVNAIPSENIGIVTLTNGWPIGCRRRSARPTSTTS